MADVFISYARADADRAWHVAEALKSEGFRVWRDLEIRAGERFDERIESALEGVGCVLVLWSEAASKSKWVRSEADWAEENGKLVSAAIAPDVKRPLQFRHIHTEDLSAWRPGLDHAPFRNLVCAIREKTGVRTERPVYNNRPPSATRPPVADVEDILPCLADRSDQADALRKLVRENLGVTPRQPLVCILPGPTPEMHETFVERFYRIMLPRALGLANCDRSVDFWRMSWPEQSGNLAARLERLKGELWEELDHPEGGDDEELRRELVSRGVSLVVRSNIYQKMWGDDDPELIERWVAFWQSIPRLGPRQMIVVALCLRYGDRPGGWFRSLFAGGRASASMRRYVTQSAAQPSGVACLPELKPLFRQHVSEWATTTVPKYYDDMNTGVLEMRATTPFANEDDQKPMRELIDPMRAAIEEAARKT